MARRPASLGFEFPTRFEPALFFEAHQNGVQGAGGKARSLAEGITVDPVRRAYQQGVEEEESLPRIAEAHAHAANLPM